MRALVKFKGEIQLYINSRGTPWHQDEADKEVAATVVKQALADAGFPDVEGHDNKG